MNTLRLRRHESFSIREGWIEKAINAIMNNNERNIFSKNDGIEILGIGSNMVKSLKYWLISMGIVDDKNNYRLTEFGSLLYEHDRYLEDQFSWSFIHYKLSSNFDDAPIFYIIFNHFKVSHFTKDMLVNFVTDFLSQEYKDLNEKYIDEDAAIFIKTYLLDDFDNNPEENYNSPLGKLGLILKNGKDAYEKTKISSSRLDYRVVYYALQETFEGKTFEISEALNVKNSPCKLFNIDKNLFNQYLYEMKNADLITINKTAGLNTAYFNKSLSLKDIFDDYFGGAKHEIL
jgi:hypothetical protein